VEYIGESVGSIDGTVVGDKVGQEVGIDEVGFNEGVSVTSIDVGVSVG
jgi:hypothetical protein